MVLTKVVVVGSCIIITAAIALGVAYLRAGTVRDPASLGTLVPAVSFSRDPMHCDPIGRRVLRAGLRRTVSCFWIERDRAFSFLVDAGGSVFSVHRQLEVPTRDSALVVFAAVHRLLLQNLKVVKTCPSAPSDAVAGVNLMTDQLRVSLRIHPQINTRLGLERSVAYSVQLDAGMGLAVSCKS
jgi:hypothetical protein